MNMQKSDRRQDGERGGHSCLAFARAGLGYLYIKTRMWVTIYAMQRKEKKWGKGKKKCLKLGPAHDRHAVLYAKGSLVNNKRGINK